MVAVPHSSAAGVLSLLSEPEPIIQEHALRTLSPLVTQFWAEISEHIALMSVRTIIHLVSILILISLSHTVRACTKTRLCQNQHETQRHCLRVRSTIRLESTTKPCRLPSVLQARSQQRSTSLDLKSMLRLLSVSLLNLPISCIVA
jgi:hypothetical protein